MNYRLARSGMSRALLRAATLIGIGALATVAIAPVADAAPRQTRIINGMSVSAGDYTTRWPFIAALLTHGTTNTYDAQFCGGSLIAPSFVLTAAHCVTSSAAGNPVKEPSSMDVLLGTRMLGDGSGTRIEVQQIIRHPDYDHGTTANDVALLFLATPATGVPTVDLVGSGDGVLWGNGAGFAIDADGPYVGGWGNMSAATGGNSFPAELRDVQIPLASDADCAGASPGLGASFQASNMICGGIVDTDGNPADGVTNGKDTCQGDSGGPLIVYANPIGYKLAGLTSWGFGCASDTYGVYTRVAAFTEWINGAMTGGNTDPTDGGGYGDGGWGEDDWGSGEGDDDYYGGDPTDDTWWGEDTGDSYDGDTGDNWMDGGEGDDNLDGGTGDDDLYGGYGDDDVYGGEGTDEMWGGDGTDDMWGGDGYDELAGGDDGDNLYGEDGDDRLDGEVGEDHLWGGDGDDYGWGGEDGDWLYGDGGDDWLYGEDGDDDLFGGSGGDNLDGGDGDDDLHGGAGADDEDGNAGSDDLWGDAGNDTENGGAGNDRLRGGKGRDRLNGGAGRDTIYATETGKKKGTRSKRRGGRDIVKCGAGVDTVYADRGDKTRGCEHVHRP